MKEQVDVNKIGGHSAILGSTVQGATDPQKEALEDAKELFRSLSIGDQLRVSGYPGGSPKNKIEGRVHGKEVSVDLAAQTFLYTIHVK
jgi:hypothetical protein